MGFRPSPLRARAGRLAAGALGVLAFLLSACDSPDSGGPDSGGDGRENAEQAQAAPPSLASRFDEERAWALLEEIVAIGPRISGTIKNGEHRDQIEAELRSAGLEVVRESFTSPTPVGQLSFENLYADIPARTGAASPIIVLASHFDTKRGIPDFVGANDGGSSTAVLLELARVLADRRSDVTWRLLFLDGEEAVQPTWIDPDNRYGSRHHVAQLQKSGLIQRVKAMVLLDLVGDRDLRFHTDLNSHRELLTLLFQVARDNGLGDHVGGPAHQILDDHISFRNAGVPAVDLIDLSFGPGNSYWHTADDTLAHCSSASLGVTGRLVLHAIPALEAWALRR